MKLNFQKHPDRALEGLIPRLGGDPEFFLLNSNGEVVESGEVIPQKPSQFTRYKRDGVQAEITMSTSTCREALFDMLGTALMNLNQEAKEKGYSISFEQLYEIPPDALGKMSEECRKLGCMPSLNIYGASGMSVDGATYPWRSAGGHIHLGFGDDTFDPHGKIVRAFPDWQNRPLEPLVALLDILLGNTFVLLDRSPQEIRRRTYGLAGEYRMPAHGLEYRVLSNFWTRHYLLLSLAYGIARQCVGYWWYGMADDLFKLVDLTLIQQAINTNDASLALSNLERVEDWLNAHTEEGNPLYDYSPPLVGNRLTYLKRFAQEKLYEELIDPHTFYFKPCMAKDALGRPSETTAIHYKRYLTGGWEKFVMLQMLARPL